MYCAEFYGTASKHEKLFAEWSLSAQKEDHVMENENPDRIIMRQSKYFIVRLFQILRFRYLATLAPKCFQVYRLDFWIQK